MWISRPDPERISRPHRLRSLVALAGLLLASGTGTWAAVARDVAPRESARANGGMGAGLVIHNVAVESDEPDASGRQLVGFDISWTGPTFPGVYRCTWRAMGPDGAVVGTYTDVVVGLRTTAHLTLPIQVTSKAVDADASCQDQRLDTDTGEAYSYAFSNVRAVPIDAHAVDVFFDARWLGAAHPGPVTCTLGLFDEVGSQVASQQVTIMIATGTGVGLSSRVWLDTPLPASPTTASIEGCRPFTG
jgi:hypothetical protein